MTKIRGRQIDKSYEVYLALYQGVSGTEEAQNVYRHFSPDFFDLVVVDECHRGSAAADSAWREILAYFAPAVQFGLTATPKETETVSNIDYFGEPLYTYSLKQGIEDGFLAPYKVLRVNLDTDVDGWQPEEGQLDKYGNLIEQREYNVRDYDRTLVIDDRTQLVAQRIAEYMRATDPYQKTIVFCVDIDHAERMRSALVNALGGEAATNRRYVMRITGDNDEGRLELDNFISPEEPYPVIATTSKLMTTGVDAQTCKLIVLDTVINSMTEFKQIIGRGTRLRPDLGKTHFTIIDFRNATRLFRDPDFDGEPIQAEDFDADEPLQPRALRDSPEATDGAAGDATADETSRPVRFVVADVPVEIIAERVQYYDTDGKLVTKSFVEFSRENVRKVYGSLDDFLRKWSAADRKQAVLVELLEHGVMLDKLQAQTDAEMDPFDLICAIAFDRPPLTRQERARQAQQDDIFAQYGDVARAVLSGLLEKYADQGIDALEEAAEASQMGKVLQLDPFRELGSPVEIVNAFGGKAAYVDAVRRLRQAIYQAA
jgi:type I restriction enzyme R subunit